MTWPREILGIALLGLGIYFFFGAVGFLKEGTGRPLDAGLLALMGIVVFNAGSHLLKVAIAARILMREKNGGAGKGSPPAPPPPSPPRRPA